MAVRDRKQQLFIRQITEGILSERDLLLSYTIGEFYNEMSLFIEEGETKKAILKKQEEELRRRR
jgi:hypothetical protein